MTTRALHVHIDRIVVEGLPASGQARFTRALEGRLREMAESGLAAGFKGGTRKRIAGLSAGELRPGATAEQAAAQVAGAIGRAVTGAGEVHQNG
jgi:hypothetical protein